MGGSIFLSHSQLERPSFFGVFGGWHPTRPRFVISTSCAPLRWGAQWNTKDLMYNPPKSINFCLQNPFPISFSSMPSRFFGWKPAGNVKVFLTIFLLTQVFGGNLRALPHPWWCGGRDADGPRMQRCGELGCWGLGGAFRFLDPQQFFGVSLPTLPSKSIIHAWCIPVRCVIDVS